MRVADLRAEDGVSALDFALLRQDLHAAQAASPTARAATRVAAPAISGLAGLLVGPESAGGRPAGRFNSALTPGKPL